MPHSRDREGPLHSLQRRRLLGALSGAAFGWTLASTLAPVPSAVLVSLLLAAIASQVGALRLSPLGFWLLIGAGTGGVVGTAQALAEKAQQVSPAEHGEMRLITVLLLAAAGVIAGLCLGRDARRADRRHPRDLLRSVSGLTTGLFALLVTIVFLHQGLDGARTFSSRLSTTLTIVVVSVTLPGWLVQQCAHPPVPRLPIGGQQP